MNKLRVALVYDRINKFGGAERVLMALHEIWPVAPIYTSVYDPDRAAWANTYTIIPSFLQNIPFAKRHHEWFAWVTPMAFESFNFDAFDVVISVTSAEAKNIITKPDTLHICYCLTPTRYLWSGIEEYRNNPNIGLPDWLVRLGLNSLVGVLRSWDLIASRRPDRYISISQLIKRRIKKYYGQNVASVIYPPVDVNDVTMSIEPKNSRSYYLVVARLVGYKRVDIVVDAFNILGWPLVIVGDGIEKTKLMKRAKHNITFTGSVTETQLQEYYKICKAFVFAGSEDFGIAAVEAQSAGKPVIAYADSGLAEIIIPGKTGELFELQTVRSLIESLKKSESKWYDSHLCRKQAEKFSKNKFKLEIQQAVEELYDAHKQSSA